jgi:hypothetical protein
MTQRTITPDEWGQDHWLTLLYIETRIVDYDGFLDPSHMRMNGNTHPTYLKHGNKEPGHNDYDCLADMEAAGLIDYKGNNVTLTDLGWRVAAEARRHRAQDKETRKWDRFNPTSLSPRPYEWVTVAEVEQMLNLYQRGLSYAAIGQIVGRSPSTVGFHIRQSIAPEERQTPGNHRRKRS